MIVLQDVSKVYPNGTRALSDINITIPERDFVFLVGPSGAGKSTFIRLLIREELPTTGRVFVDEQDVTRLKRHQVPYLRRKIGVVFQDFKLLPNKTVFENVAFALEVTGETRATIEAEVPKVISLVGLEDRAENFPHQLSGGEQQRVAIARAMVHQPLILIADEPTGNLDPMTSWEIIQLLIRINTLGTTMLMATHNQEVVNAMRRRVLALENGRISRDQAMGSYHHEY